MTFPKQESEKFIFLDYYKTYPLAPLLRTFSEPAKSTKVNLPFLYPYKSLRLKIV